MNNIPPALVVRHAAKITQHATYQIGKGTRLLGTWRYRKRRASTDEQMCLLFVIRTPCPSQMLLGAGIQTCSGEDGRSRIANDRAASTSLKGNIPEQCIHLHINRARQSVRYIVHICGEPNSRNATATY